MINGVPEVFLFRSFRLVYGVHSWSNCPRNSFSTPIVTNISGSRVLSSSTFRPTLLLGNLIERTCRQTPFYDLCIWTLTSNPESRNVDVKKLAEIMVDSLKTKATDTLDLIDELLQDGLALEPAMQKALTSCAERYNVIIRGDVPEIIEALKTGNYEYAERGTNDAAIEANSCEMEFPGKSPLTDMNKVVHDVSVIATSIVKKILNRVKEMALIRAVYLEISTSLLLDSNNLSGSSQKPKVGIIIGIIGGFIILLLFGGLLFFLCKGRQKGYKCEVFVDVAVKRLTDFESPGGDAAFQREVEMISIAVHKNLLWLIWLLHNTDKTPFRSIRLWRILSVAYRLRELKPGEPVLVWLTRKRVALAAARGLEYLHEHCNPKIIHRDVKAAIVFLDEDFEAVIGDFGLAKLVDVRRTDVTTPV
ncbi:hypothetical protein CRYUN_Cryun30bG0102700 [Craigia yunnanensis]